MMKKLFYVILLATLFFTGCNKEEDLASIAKEVELCASIEHESTRAAFDENGDFLWTVNDAIGVTTTESDTSFSKMIIKEGGAGNPTATFTANHMAGTPEGYAVYPYNQGHSIDGTTLTYNFPASYDYTIQDHSYFVSDGRGNSFNPPMWATILNGSVGFKHLGGVLCIKIADLPAGNNQTLTVTTTNKITGTFTVDLNVSTPKLTTSASEENNVVTFNYSNDTKSDRVFYVPVPVGTYERITIAFQDNDENVSVYFDNVEITRRKLKRLTIGGGSIEGGEATEVSDINAANNALMEGEKDITITSAATGTITIPEQTSTDTEISIRIGEVTGQILIDDAEDSNQSIQTLNLTVPEENVDDLVIDLPNTTVYVNGVINNLTATTAANTLIVGENTIITNLIVKGGNVRVCANGTISSISRHDDNADKLSIIYYEEGAVIPNQLGENILAIKGDEDKWNGESYYEPSYDEATKTYSIKNAYELAWVAVTVNGGNNLEGYTISLENDIDLNNKQWTPIGTKTNNFQGAFNGQKHTISNLNVESTSSYVGFFGYTTNSDGIKNVNFHNAVVKGGNYVAVVAGCAYTTKEFFGINVTGSVKVEATGQDVAVITGHVYGNVKYITIDVDDASYVKAQGFVGGIVGYPGEGNSTIENVVSNIDVIGEEYIVGGIVGMLNYSNTIKNASCSGDVSLTAGDPSSKNKWKRIGGIAGCWSDTEGRVNTIENCSYTGTLSSQLTDGTVATEFDNMGYVGRHYMYGKVGTLVINGLTRIANDIFVDKSGQYLIGSALGLKTLAELVNSGNDFAGITVKLTNDINLDNSVNINNSVKIDLNGNDIDMNASTFILGNEASLTLENKASENANAYIEGSRDIIKASNKSVINIGAGVNLTTTGENCFCVWIPGEAEGVILNTAGNLTATGIGSAAIYHNGTVNSGTINITGGELKGTEEMAVYIAGNADVTISGDVMITGKTALEQRAGSLTIEDGNFIANGNPFEFGENGNGSTTVGAAVALSVHDGKTIEATINGGTFNGYKSLYVSDNVNLTVNGGTFYGALHNDENGFINVMGGTFTDPSVSGYIDPSKEVVEKNNTWTVVEKFVASIGSVNYTSLQAAIDDVKGAEEVIITLAADITLSDAITILEGTTVTLDLNGKTISQTSSTPVSMITNNGNMTIKDSSDGSGKIDFTFNGTVNNSVAANTISNRGTLVVEDGIISNKGTDSQIGYVIDNYNGSTLTVNDGNITASGSSYYDGIRLFCGSNMTTVTINNGKISTIWAQNPSSNKATEVYGTVIINGGTIETTYYENYTTVKVKSGLTTTVKPYGEGYDNTTTNIDGEYTVYSFVH